MQDREALRRRLYAPGATTEDVEAYSASRPPAAAAVAAPRPGGQRRPVAAVVVAAVLAAVLLGLALVLPRPAAPAAPSRAPVDLGLVGADRADLLANLARGTEAGISAYLVTHSSPRALGEVDHPITVEGAGEGSGTLPLFPPGAGAGAGRASVLVVIDRDADVSWVASRLVAGPRDPMRHPRTVARRGGPQQPGELTAGSFAYAAGSRPTRLSISAPDGVRWGAAVVFSDPPHSSPSPS